MESRCTEAVHQNYRDLVRFAYRMTGSPESAEDIVQESFFRLSREPQERLEETTHIRRWLFVVVRNLCISWHRRNSQQKTESLEERHESIPLHDSPSETFLEEEKTRLVKEAVLSLPMPLREMIILREYEQHSYDEIALLAGCPVGTVRSRLAKARELLKEKLQPVLEKNR